METILVKSLEIKKSKFSDDDYVVLDINGNRKASVFDSQEANYVINEVGVGGSFIGNIVQKGKYLNIENVDMTLGKRASDIGAEVVKMQLPANIPGNLMSQKDVQITAAVLLKGVIEMAKGHTFENLQDEAKYMCEAVVELRGVLKVAIDLLENE